jgi:hypothetical protein
MILSDIQTKYILESSGVLLLKVSLRDIYNSTLNTHNHIKYNPIRAWKAICLRS